MSYMESAAHHYATEAYEREQARESKTPKAPTTEAEALKQYKLSHSVKWPWENKTAQIKRLEALAAEHGWTALSDYKTEIRAQRAELDKQASDARGARRATASEKAAHLTNEADAAEQYRAARDNHDSFLANAIKRTAETNGWNMNRPNTTELAAQIHEQYTELLTSRDNAIAPYQADLKAGRITSEYVADQIAASTTERQDRLTAITETVNKYYADAEASYDQAYRSLATPTGDTNEQLLAEMRATKAWERTQREMANIDATGLLGQLSQRVKDADPTTLRVLIEEMPSYLAGRGVPDAPAAVRRAIGQRPELKDANARVTEAAKLRDLTVHNSKQIGDVLNTIAHNDTDARVAYVDPTSIDY